MNMHLVRASLCGAGCHLIRCNTLSNYGKSAVITETRCLILSFIILYNAVWNSFAPFKIMEIIFLVLISRMNFVGRTRPTK
jgi:hypothetical protein